jgi:diguanylate cyclase (GGDEF)-like protein/PAS domain S-box-containing protein
MSQRRQIGLPPGVGSDWIWAIAESSIAHVLAAGEIGLFQLDTATGLATWDGVSSAILGLGNAEQLEPSRLPIHPDDADEVSRRLERISNGGGGKDVDIRILRPSGEVRWIRSSARLAPAIVSGRQYILGIITDVTERKHQSIALLEAERSANDLLDSLPHIIWSADAAGRCNFLSRQWREFTGRPADLDSGDGWAAALHPDDRERVLAKWLSSVREKVLFEAEFRLRDQSGQYRWFATRGLPHFNDAGDVTCWRGTCTDIHDRILAEEALAEAQQFQLTAAERLRSTLDLIPQMVWSMAGNGRRPDFYNRRWYEFTGLPQGSLGGSEWGGLSHPDDIRTALRKLRRCMQTGDRYDVRYRVRNREGHYRWVRSEARSERDKDGRVVRWYGTCTDIHEAVVQQHALEESEHQAKRILNSVPHVIWTAKSDGTLDFLSDQWAKVLEESGSEMRGDAWLSAVHRDDLANTIAAWQTATSTNVPYEAEFRVRWGPADYRWIMARAIPESDPDGQTSRWYGTCTDMHDRVLAQQALHESERLGRGIIEATPDCMSLLDADGNVLFVNRAVIAAYEARDPAELLGRPWGSGFSKSLRANAKAAVKVAQAGGVGRLTVLGGPAGDRWFDVLITPIFTEDSKLSRLLVASRDVTEQKKAQEEAQWAANHDPMTGLPNRFLVQSVIDRELDGDDGDGCSLGLILMDADHLKRVNDGLGHDAGDAMLCEIGRRLRVAVGEAGTVGRLGGDEFAIVLPDLPSEAVMMTTAEAVLEALKEPFAYAGRMIECHASGGAAVLGCYGRTRAELMKNADVALYAAKAAGRGTVRLFEPALRETIQRRDSMLSLATDALNEDRIFAHYQPKVDLRTGKLAGLEALLRWEHQRDGIQGPDQIAAAFEDTRLAARVSDRIVDAVIRDVVEWRKQQLAFGHVAINASAAEFRIGNFAERLLERLGAADIPTHQIQLEVTETVFVGRGAEYVHQALELLSGAGMTIALDDFGTGYASLSHLRHFPVDIIKIDRSFVRDMGTTPDAKAIVAAVISLGTTLNMEVVAEGIENAQQQKILQKLGCHYGQGFLYSKALPASEVTSALLRPRRTISGEQWGSVRRAA